MRWFAVLVVGIGLLGGAAGADGPDRAPEPPAPAANDAPATGHPGGGYLPTPHGEPVDLAADPLPDPLDRTWTLAAQATNFDGTEWWVWYQGEVVPRPVGWRARIVAEEVTRVYGDLVGRSRAACAGATNPDPHHWGFEHEDPDCRLDVFLWNLEHSSDPLSSCLGCVLEDGDEVTLHLAPLVKERFHQWAMFLDPVAHDFRSIARSVASHEFFHNLQQTILSEGPSGPYRRELLEGTGRFVETLTAPEINDHPSSVWHARTTPLAQSGVGWFALFPDRALCSRAYDAGLYWGHLYSEDGGIETIRTLLQEMTGHLRDECATALPAAVDRTLAARPGAHDTHVEALTDFGLRLYTGDFAWGRPDGAAVTDWGRWLPPVARQPHTGGSSTHSVGASGLQYVTIAPAPDGREVVVATDDGGWELRLLVRRTGGTVDVTPLEPGTPAPLGGDDAVETVVLAVRTGSSSGTYTVTTGS